MPSDPIVINLNIVKQDRIRLFSSDKHTAMHHMAFQCMKEISVTALSQQFPRLDIL